MGTAEEMGLSSAEYTAQAIFITGSLNKSAGMLLGEEIEEHPDLKKLSDETDRPFYEHLKWILKFCMDIC